MFQSIINFHKQLIKPNSSASSSRYVALLTFYTSTGLIIYTSIIKSGVPFDLLALYVSVFSAVYVSSKTVGLINTAMKK